MKNLSIFDKRQLSIARKTLRMTDTIIGVMGSMTKSEAKAIIRKFSSKQ